MKRVLVNDRPLHAAQTGVAMYLRNVLAHWPDDAKVELEGFWEHRLKRKSKWPARQDASANAAPTGNEPLEPIELAPLSTLSMSGKVPRRPSFFKRWLLTGGHAIAFRMAAKPKRYAATWEPNHLAIPSRLPSVATMCDLSVLEHPQWHPADRVRHWEKHAPRAVERTKRWIAISQFTADRMTALLGIPPQKIDMIPLAARPMAYPAREQATALLRAAGVTKPYFLALGTIEPRKNLSILLDAWSQLAKETRGSAQLIFAGGAGWGDAANWRSLVDHEVAGEVMTTGYVSHRAAAALLAGATALLVPSRYEGFGLPLLEAMAAGTPVICSDIPVFAEVAGDAAGLVDATDPKPWADAINRACQDETWIRMLRESGRSRNALFTWQETASRHARVLEAIAGT